MGIIQETSESWQGDMIGWVFVFKKVEMVEWGEGWWRQGPIVSLSMVVDLLRGVDNYGEIQVLVRLRNQFRGY